MSSTSRRVAVVVALVAIGCAGAHPKTTTFTEDPPAADAGAVVTPDASDNNADTGDFGRADAKPPPQCGAPTTPADPNVIVMNPTYANDYKPYVLGPVPGIPASRLGGCVISETDPNTMLIAVRSEQDDGAIVSVQLEREPCGHIVGFKGNATVVANTPFVDANLLWGPNHVLFYSQWPMNTLSELLGNQNAPSYSIDLATLGVGGGGPGGLGFVPPNLADPGGLRAVTWPGGDWFHLTYAAQQQSYEITLAVKMTTLPNGPGGFGYVPQGSPGFPKQSLVTSEWDGDKVAVYEVDTMGDPIATTRQEFFTKFPKPWGAYFEPKTGDFIFLTWQNANAADQLYIVQGFAPPPPPPPPPR